MNALRRVAGKILSRVHYQCTGLWERSRIFAFHARAQVRCLLMRAGVPLQQEFLVVGCMKADHGFFAEFTLVLISLRHYEAFKTLYAGLHVDFSGQGYYYDRTVGENWWDYYFEPIAIGHRQGAVTRIFDNDNNPFFEFNFGTHPLVSNEVDGLPRKAWADLVRRHIRVRPHIREKADRFVRDNFEGAFVLGIHYRGTDKIEESPRVPYEQVIAAVRDATRLAHPRPWKLFVATDEQPFVEHVRHLFPGKTIHLHLARSTSEPGVQGLHFQLAGDYRNGEGALLDCLLLSRCDRLIRTESTLGLCATLFNPEIPVTLIYSENAAPAVEGGNAAR
jgi:hypothetical protein